MLRSLKMLFARQDDPYLGVDLDLARKMASVFWVMGALLTLALWPLSPPNDSGAIGSSGWAVGSVAIFVGVLFAYAIRARPSLWSFKLMLAAAYVGVVGISVMQWLAGGNGAPYLSLLLLPVLFISAIYPPRAMAIFLAAVGLSLAAPPIYDGLSGNAAAGAIAPLVLWTALSAAILLLMKTIRGQRIALRHEQERARKEARLDELTVIGNRRAFEETLDEEIARADRMGTPLSMAMGDIEHFKRINDEFGHLEGDRCLRGVAQAMDSELRTPDRVFRWGGDEFTLLLPGTDAEGANVVSGRVQAKVSAACRRPDNEPVWIHFAAAELRPNMTATELTEAADLALLAERAQDHRERA
jgi:diguanylate cyclase (GGDEF)-like protein